MEQKFKDEASYWEGRLSAIQDLRAHFIQEHSNLIKEIDGLILVTSKHIEELNNEERNDPVDKYI